MKSLSESIVQLQRSGIRQVMDLAFARPDMLRLEVGDPDFPTPPHIVEAAAAAAVAGYTHYTPSRGLAEVREAMAEKISRFNRFSARPDDVVVSAGGGHGLFAVCRALCDPGDRILVPNPGWPNYHTIAALCRAEAVGYSLPAANGFLPDLERLEKLAARAGMKALIINTPSNPTGAVWSEAVIGKVLEICSRHDLFLIADECYEAIVFDRNHVSPASLDDQGRTISVFTLSKTYAMTGWRVGYVTASPQILDQVAKVVENSVSCATAVSQKAAEAALRGDQTCVGDMVDAYRQRRGVALSALGEAGLTPASVPGGAFYVMVAVPANDTMKFARRLASEAAVTVAPGETFGTEGQGMVRLSLASEPSTIKEGIKRLGLFARAAASEDPST